jgi:hypothetical protein
MNAVSQQSASRQDGPRLQKACLCHLRPSVCQEKHLLEKCDKFHKMSPSGGWLK